VCVSPGVALACGEQRNTQRRCRRARALEASR
jgi:hypothetical protein